MGRRDADESRRRHRVPGCSHPGTPQARRHVEALPGSWANARAISGDLVAAVQALMEAPGGDIGVHASISVARTLLRAGVVDQLRLLIAPALVGSGRRLLDDLAPLALTLTSCAGSPSGSLLLTYRVSAPHEATRIG